VTDTHIADLLEELTPTYDDRRGDWERVATSARGRRAHRSAPWWLMRLGFAAAAIAVAATLVLAWPSHGNQGGLLDRALAAIGEGPVLHVVLRGEWGGTLVDLKSGKRSAVHGENEIWYDTMRGRVHLVSRLGGAVQHEELYEPKQPPADLAALGREYKHALESGTARISGEATIDGVPVVWVTIHSEMLPDVADGKDHEWAQQVAVSRRTFKPIALRETRDGEPGPETGQLVRKLEFLPAGGGDFSASKDRSVEGTAFKQGREPITPEQARATLGRTPLWLGREYRGLPLAQAYRETTSTGRRHEVRVTGPIAAAAMKCRDLRGAKGGDCIRALGVAPIEIRPDGVFTSEGPIVWTEEQSALVLFYGSVGDDPSTAQGQPIPLFDRPHVSVTETPQPWPFGRGAWSYLPPAGSVFVAAGGRSGVLQIDGIHVTIEASNENAILAAAGELKVMSD
jgi:hypothetical protein